MDENKKDVIYLIILQGLNYLIPIILMPYLMIKLQSTAYGYLSFSLAIIQYFILFIDFGFNLSATKRIAVYKSNKEELNKIFTSTLLAKTFFFLISTFIFIILLFIPNFKEYRIALLCTFPQIVGNTFTFNWLFQGIGKIRLLSIISMASRILILPFIFLIVKTPQDYPQAIFIQSLVYVSTALISTIWLLKNNVVSKTKIKISNIKYEIKESFPLFLSSASISVYTQLFVVILGLMTSAEIVGKYSAAEKIMRSLCFLFYIPINQVYYPKIAHLSFLNKNQALSLLKHIKKYTLLIMSILSIGLFCGGPLLERFLGNDYNGINILLKILAIGPLAIASGGILGQMGLLAIGNKKSKKDFQQTYFIAAPFSLSTVLILSHFYSEYGAAISLLLTEYLVAFLMYYHFKKDVIK